MWLKCLWLLTRRGLWSVAKWWFFRFKGTRSRRTLCLERPNRRKRKCPCGLVLLKFKSLPLALICVQFVSDETTSTIIPDFKQHFVSRSTWIPICKIEVNESNSSSDIDTRPTIFTCWSSRNGWVVHWIVSRDLLWNQSHHCIIGHLKAQTCNFYVNESQKDRPLEQIYLDVCKFLTRPIKTLQIAQSVSFLMLSYIYSTFM